MSIAPVSTAGRGRAVPLGGDALRGSTVKATVAPGRESTQEGVSAAAETAAAAAARAATAAEAAAAKAAADRLHAMVAQRGNA
ncbi:hypothetical protein Efla_005273 [Eimeria flavescens]